MDEDGRSGLKEIDLIYAFSDLAYPETIGCARFAHVELECSVFLWLNVHRDNVRLKLAVFSCKVFPPSSKSKLQRHLNEILLFGAISHPYQGTISQAY